MALFFFLIYKSFLLKKYSYHLNHTVFITDLIFEQLCLITNNYFVFIIFNLILFNCLTDIINNNVYTIVNVIILIITLSTTKNINIYTLFFLTILKTIGSIYKNIGDGDIEFLLCIHPLFNFKQMMIIINLASLTSLFYMLKCRKNKIYFIPFLSFYIFLIYILKL